MLLLGLLVVHDTVRSGQDNETELTGWEKVGGPFINLERDIYTRCITSGANIRTFHPLVGVQSICSPLVEPIPRLLTIQTCLLEHGTEIKGADTQKQGMYGSCPFEHFAS